MLKTPPHSPLKAYAAEVINSIGSTIGVAGLDSGQQAGEKRFAGV
jgi:hypothetical protein